MPADASIYGQVRPFTMESPLAQAGQALQVQQLSQQVQEGQRKFSLEDDISTALSESGGDLRKASQTLAQRGRGTASLSLADKATSQEKSTLEQKLKIAEAVSSDGISLDAAYREALQNAGGNQQVALQTLKPIYDQIRQKWAQMGHQLPENFDPVSNIAGIGQAKEVASYLTKLLPDRPKESDLATLQRERAALVAKDPNDPRIKEYDADILKKTTHQPATTVNVSTEKKYGEKFAGNVADADTAMLDAARKAPDLAERSNRVLETLASGKVMTGAGADYRLALGKALNMAGANNDETISNTETLVSNLAQNTLDAIKGSGLGAGNGFSNADRDFLEKAVGGKITLEANTIKRLATLSHRAAEKSAEKWSARVKDIPGEALTATGISKDPVKVPSLYKGGPTTNQREVALPDGRVMTFPTPAAAKRFREDAGL